MNSKEWINSLNFKLTFIKCKIENLEDEYQRYTTVDTDKVNEIILKEEIDLYKQIKQDLEVLEIVKKHKLLNYVLKNKKCAKMYGLTQETINKIKEWLE